MPVRQAPASSEFEIDDQTPEDLSIGLERLQEMRAAFDVLQMPA